MSVFDFAKKEDKSFDVGNDILIYANVLREDFRNNEIYIYQKEVDNHLDYDFLTIEDSKVIRRSLKTKDVNRRILDYDENGEEIYILLTAESDSGLINADKSYLKVIDKAMTVKGETLLIATCKDCHKQYEAIAVSDEYYYLLASVAKTCGVIEKGYAKGRPKTCFTMVVDRMPKKKIPQ